MRDQAFLIGAVGGFIIASVSVLLVRRSLARGEAARIQWIRSHRPCWFCEGPEGARLRVEQLKHFTYAPYRRPSPPPYAPAPGDCDYCRWPPAKLPRAQVRT